jgi:hypothetical protein
MFSGRFTPDVAGPVSGASSHSTAKRETQPAGTARAGRPRPPGRSTAPSSGGPRPGWTPSSRPRSIDQHDCRCGPGRYCAQPRKWATPAGVASGSPWTRHTAGSACGSVSPASPVRRRLPGPAWRVRARRPRTRWPFCTARDISSFTPDSSADNVRLTSVPSATGPRVVVPDRANRTGADPERQMGVRFVSGDLEDLEIRRHGPPTRSGDTLPVGHARTDRAGAGDLRHEWAPSRIVPAVCEESDHRLRWPVDLHATLAAGHGTRQRELGSLRRVTRDPHAAPKSPDSTRYPRVGGTEPRPAGRNGHLTRIGVPAGTSAFVL